MNTARLRGVIAERGKTQHDVAVAVGMSDKTFYSKMKRGTFGTDEAEKIICFLQIDSLADKVDIFLQSK